MHLHLQEPDQYHTPENLFSLTKHTRFWEFVKYALDNLNIDAQVDNNVKQEFNENLNKIMNNVFEHKQHKQQEPVKSLLVLIYDAGERAFDYTNCKYQYEQIRDTRTFDRILVCGNGSK